MTAGGPAEFRRGWPIILVCAAGCGFGLAPLPVYTIGVFTKPVAAALDVSRAEVQGVLSFFVLGMLISSPVWGVLMDRWGVRRMAILSTAGLAAGLATIATFTRSLESFYGLAFVTALLGGATTPMSWSRAVLEWFNARRGLALGIALSGTGLTATLGPSYVTWLVGLGGWKAGFFGLALLPGLISLPLVLFLMRPAPHAVRSHEPSGTPVEEGLSFREAVRVFVSGPSARDSSF